MTATTLTPQSAATSPAPAPERPRVGTALPEPTAVPFTRLVGVELRKMVDTLAGRWLVIITVAIGAIVMALFAAFADVDEITVGMNLAMAGLPFGIILPVVGIMAATAEWSQRAGLVTFTLEPRRGRVVAARIGAGLLLGLAVVLVTAVVAYLVTGISGLAGLEVSYALPGWVWVGFVAMMLIGVLQGIAFGFFFLNTPAAIVSVLALPMVFTIATGFNETVARIAEWLDLSRASAPLMEGVALSGTQWGQLATSSLTWVVLPLAIGAWRVLRREVK